MARMTRRHDDYDPAWDEYDGNETRRAVSDASVATSMMEAG